jgi:osmotically-inducible protein OsmY
MKTVFGRHRRRGASLLIGVFLALSAACAPTQVEKPAVERGDDAVITASVKAALERDPTFSGWRIDVETSEGVVRLTGFVRSQSDKERAQEIASETKGVKSVRNELFVRITPR